MRITFILPDIALGGGTKVAMIHALNLQRLGHQVTLIAPPPAATLFQKVAHRLTRRQFRFDSFPEAKLLNCRLLDERRPVIDTDVPDADVIVATWWETAEWVNRLSLAKGVKVYFIQHHEVFSYLPTDRSRATYTLPLRKIVVANWLRDVMRETYGDDKVAVVPNSIDHSQFYPLGRSKQNIPSVGVLYATAPFKGLDTAQAAIRLLHRNIPNARVIYFGSERPCPRNPLDPAATFHYRPAQQTIREIYSACDVWLTASTAEGFNLPAMEAMACGTPVVSTRAGWPAESIVQQVNGILTEVNDISALATGLEWVLTRPHSQWNMLSEAAIKTVQSSSWQRSSKLFEAALMSCLSYVTSEI
jgi:glycosyltransferase involved in cell wall biosynthesis